MWKWNSGYFCTKNDNPMSQANWKTVKEYEQEISDYQEQIKQVQNNIKQLNSEKENNLQKLKIKFRKKINVLN